MRGERLENFVIGSSLFAVTRFAFSAVQRETSHGVSKLTDNVAWHWLPDSNDGCSKRWAPLVVFAAAAHSLAACPVLCLYMHAKVANLTSPRVLFGATLSSRTFNVPLLPRPPADNGENWCWPCGLGNGCNRSPDYRVARIVIVLERHNWCSWLIAVRYSGEKRYADTMCILYSNFFLESGERILEITERNC